MKKKIPRLLCTQSQAFPGPGIPETIIEQRLNLGSDLILSHLADATYISLIPIKWEGCLAEQGPHENEKVIENTDNL